MNKQTESEITIVQPDPSPNAAVVRVPLWLRYRKLRGSGTGGHAHNRGGRRKLIPLSGLLIRPRLKRLSQLRVRI